MHGLVVRVVKDVLRASPLGENIGVGGVGKLCAREVVNRTLKHLLFSFGFLLFVRVLGHKSSAATIHKYV